MPVIFEGTEELKKIYLAQLEAKTIFVVRSQKATVYDEHFGEWWTGYMEQRRSKNITVRAITPDDPAAIHDERIDFMRNIFRTWVHPMDYTAPVEIDVYNDTVAVIEFREDKGISGFTVTNPLIAKAFKDMFALAEKGAKVDPVTHNHPWSLALTN